MMRILKATGLAACMLWTAWDANAVETAIAGSGNLTCAGYSQLRAQGIVGGMEPAMLPVIWMQGYLSGMNADRIRNGRDREVYNIPAPSDRLKRVMDQACSGREAALLAKIGVDLSEGRIKVVER